MWWCATLCVCAIPKLVPSDPTGPPPAAVLHFALMVLEGCSCSCCNPSVDEFVGDMREGGGASWVLCSFWFP